MADYKEELRLIDHNINYRALEEWWCEICGRKLLYQKSAPKPQCPHCMSSRGLLVPMKKYFIMPGG